MATAPQTEETSTTLPDPPAARRSGCARELAQVVRRLQVGGHQERVVLRRVVGGGLAEVGADVVHQDVEFVGEPRRDVAEQLLALVPGGHVADGARDGAAGGAGGGGGVPLGEAGAEVGLVAGAGVHGRAQRRQLLHHGAPDAAGAASDEGRHAAEGSPPPTPAGGGGGARPAGRVLARRGHGDLSSIDLVPS